jgi:hypothetical protein
MRKRNTVTAWNNYNFRLQMDAVAMDKSQSHTDLICNSLKMYINHKKRLQKLFAYGERVASENNFTEKEVMEELKQYRKNK